MNFLERLFGRGEKSARNIAKDRLKLVLMHDRTDIPAPVMEEIRREFLKVLSKYIEIDEQQLEVSLETVEDTQTVALLMANVPIRRVLNRKDGNEEKDPQDQ